MFSIWWKSKAVYLKNTLMIFYYNPLAFEKLKIKTLNSPSRK